MDVLLLSPVQACLEPANIMENSQRAPICRSWWHGSLDHSRRACRERKVEKLAQFLLAHALQRCNARKSRRSASSALYPFSRKGE